jgi:hypothetical protein
MRVALPGAKRIRIALVRDGVVRDTREVTVE